MSIAQSSILVKFRIRRWDGFVSDKKVSETADKVFNTTVKGGNFNKRILSKRFLKSVNAILSRAHSEHKRLTFPWQYDGVDILPSELYFSYSLVMRNLRELLDAELQNMQTQYPIEITERKPQLNGMFNPGDYPSSEALSGRFGIDIMFYPVPTADHFVLDMEKKEQDRIKADFQVRMDTLSAVTLSELYNRVLRIIDHLHDRLSDPENRFCVSLIDHVNNLAESLPGLNIFNDPILTQVSDAINEKLTDLNAAELRTDMNVRREIAKHAFDVASILRGNMP
jgi:hypothetical protein